MTARLLFHDVGHGQAIHLFTPDGKTVVIDLGCSSNFSPLEWLSKQTKVIDYLIVTHPHGDHIDEILLLDKLGIRVRQLWRPSWLTNDEVQAANQVQFKAKVDRYLKYSSDYTGPIADHEKVSKPENNGGVSIDVYSTSTCGRSNINNHSGVVVIQHATSTAIVPGDNEPPSWTELLKKPDFVSALSRADLFMASHHGRESGYCGDLFSDDRKPRLFVISDGRVQDTDATSRYSNHARGWKVHSRAGNPSEDRYALTTRSDGFIDVKLGYNTPQQPLLSVHRD